MNRILMSVVVLSVVVASAGMSDAAPVSYWTFDNNALDSGTAGNDGTLNNQAAYSTTVPAQLSGSTHSLELDGSNDYVYADPTGSVSGTYTVSAWARVRDNSTNNIFDTRRPTDTSFDMKLTGGKTIHGDIGNGSGWIATNP